MLLTNNSTSLQNVSPVEEKDGFLHPRDLQRWPLGAMTICKAYLPPRWGKIVVAGPERQLRVENRVSENSYKTTPLGIFFKCRQVIG